ncbi:MAG: hypothetical protein HY726_12875 [Candidatus Rokubacteria bacterium]|nr:hypothetical protein [Candidatus Rokubacteria bacterium]
MKALVIGVLAVGLLLSLFDLWLDSHRGWQRATPVAEQVMEPALPSASEAQSHQLHHGPALTF